MEATLAIIGLNFRTAPVSVRERFQMDESRRQEALTLLASSEGIEEVVAFSTCNRTEFVVWGDPTLAINSVLRFLTSKYRLSLCEWKNFYRLLDEQALAHAFRVSCGLDSMRVGEDLKRHFDAAWQQAVAVGSGARIEAVLRKASEVRRRVRTETDFHPRSRLAHHAPGLLASQMVEDLSQCRILLVGAGQMGEIAARSLVDRGARSLCIVDRSETRAHELARQFDVQSSSYERRMARVASADLVIAATSSPTFVLTREDMLAIAATRDGRKLVIMDFGLPRNVDPAIRDLDGVSLYELDALEKSVPRQSDTWKAELKAEKIVWEEAHVFGRQIAAAAVSPSVLAMRQRLDDICRQELESFRLEHGPFPKDQDQLIAAVSTRITRKIAGSLARESKEGPETKRHRHLTVAG